jgi:putative transposase
MRNPLRRYYGRRDLHFVTFSCYRRRPYLGTRHSRDQFVKALDQVRARWKFSLVGYVVMPEHIHLLMGEPPKGDPSKVLQVLKQKVARDLIAGWQKPPKEQMSSSFSDANTNDEHFWQRRFYDFNVRSAQKLKEKLDYMHANPVKRKLVLDPKDWPWSSWSFYEKNERGLIAIDLADGDWGEKTNTEAKSQSPHP